MVLKAVMIVWVVAGAIIWIAISLLIMKYVFKGNSLATQKQTYKKNKTIKKKKSVSKKR